MVSDVALDMERLQSVAKDTKRSPCARWKARKKLQLLERFHYKCASCPATKDLTIDHMVPVRTLKAQRKSKCNSFKWSNEALESAQILCIDCHRKKDDFLKEERYEQWMG